ncbi:hypothetical protein B0H16DRAFT_1476741 [Mycena metata]|uniref:Uncharacterized protein n=1 Tax=Mycena metata TaxID=1033252 RepID=A0AAD7HC20_9AGAR|nr:hypothetical protein B0H16DRAFT_1476741 [Mycena metata]
MMVVVAAYVVAVDLGGYTDVRQMPDRNFSRFSTQKLQSDVFHVTLSRPPPFNSRWLARFRIEVLERPQVTAVRKKLGCPRSLASRRHTVLHPPDHPRSLDQQMYLDAGGGISEWPAPYPSVHHSASYRVFNIHVDKIFIDGIVILCGHGLPFNPETAEFVRLAGSSSWDDLRLTLCSLRGCSGPAGCKGPAARTKQLAGFKEAPGVLATFYFDEDALFLEGALILATPPYSRTFYPNIQYIVKEEKFTVHLWPRVVRRLILILNPSGKNLVEVTFRPPNKRLRDGDRVERVVHLGLDSPQTVVELVLLAAIPKMMGIEPTGGWARTELSYFKILKEENSVCHAHAMALKHKLKCSSAPSGRQLFTRELHSEIIEASKVRIANQGTSKAAAYRIEPKSINQREFDGNFLLVLGGLCQGGLFGNTEMVLFYTFRNPENATTYGGPWSEFAEAAIPREAGLDYTFDCISQNAGPQTHPQTTAVTDKNGVVIFPTIDLDTIPLGDLHFLLTDYFQMCWNHRDITVDHSIVPWVDIVSDPSKFYDTAAFIFRLPLKNPAEFSSVETLTFGQFFNSTEPILFRFKAGIVAGIQSSPPTLSPGPATLLLSPSPFNPTTQSPVLLRLTPAGHTSLSPPLTPVPTTPLASLKGNTPKRKQPRFTGDQEEDSDKNPSKRKKKKPVKKIEAIAALVCRSSRRPGKAINTPKKTVANDGPKQKKGYALVTDDEESSDE